MFERSLATLVSLNFLISKRISFRRISKLNRRSKQFTREMADSSISKIAVLTECSLCLFTFDKPKCLPCIHTFCLNCLKDLVTKKASDIIQCPLCRAEFKVPGNGVEGFPNNFFIQDIMEMISDKSIEPKETELKCDQCLDEPGKEEYPCAELYCPECDQRLCTSCIQYHGKLKALKLHKLVRLEEVNKTRPRNCDKHTLVKLSHNCLQCDMSVCTECLTSEHNGHPSEKIEEASVKWGQKLLSSYNKMEDLLLSLPIMLKDGQALHKSILDEGQAQQKQIADRCDRLCDLINMYKCQFQTDLKQNIEARANKIKEQIDETSSYKRLTESHAQYIKEMRDRGSHSDIVCNSKKLLEKAQELLDNQLLRRGIQEDNSIRLTFLTKVSHEIHKKDIGILLKYSEKFLLTVGLGNGTVVEQKICEISLDKPDTINVINSTPAAITNESSACVIDNVLFAVGIGSEYNELWKCSDDKNKWTRCADMPSGRRRHCVTSVGDKIYVFGGWIDANKRALDSILCYDINSDKWTEAGKLCHDVQCSTCVTYKQCIYVFGGSDKDEEAMNAVQIYDTATCNTFLGSSPMPRAYHLMRAVLWRSKALIIGFHTCYIFDFESNTWQERVRFKTDVIHFGLTLDDDTLYISGGGACNDSVWGCRADVKCMLVEDFVSDNVEAEWRHHATLPAGAHIYAYSSVPQFK